MDERPPKTLQNGSHHQKPAPVPNYEAVLTARLRDKAIFSLNYKVQCSLLYILLRASQPQHVPPLPEVNRNRHGGGREGLFTAAHRLLTHRQRCSPTHRQGLLVTQTGPEFGSSCFITAVVTGVYRYHTRPLLCVCVGTCNMCV